MTKGSNDVEDGVASFKAVEHQRSFADGLDGDGNGARLGIGGFDGERNSFALLVQAQDDELPRALFARYPRCLNDELPDIESDGSGFNDVEHERMTPLEKPCC